MALRDANWYEIWWDAKVSIQYYPIPHKGSTYIVFHTHGDNISDYVELLQKTLGEVMRIRINPHSGIRLMEK